MGSPDSNIEHQICAGWSGDIGFDRQWPSYNPSEPTEADATRATVQTCRIEVNRMDGQGWRQWGCGREFDSVLADKLIDFMRPDPERRKMEAAGLAVPGKLFRKVPGRNEAVSREVA